MSATIDNALPVARGVTRRRLGRGRATILALGDIVALVLAYVVTYLSATQMGPLPPVSAPSWFLALVAVCAVPIWLVVFAAYGLYDNDTLRISVASFDEVRDIFHGILSGSLIFLVASQGARYLAGWWISSAVEAVVFLVCAIVLVPLLRGSIRSWVFPRAMDRRRIVIVGDGREAQMVNRKLAAHPEYGVEVVGFLGEDRSAELNGDNASMPPRIGTPDEVAELVDRYEIDRVLLASSFDSHEQLLELVRSVRRQDVQVSLVPRYFEIFTSHATLDDIEGMPVVTLPPMRLGRSSRLLKRGFDVSVSALALLFLSPVLAAVAIAIRLDSKGGAIYRQARRGREGSEFQIAKFRTMHAGAEAKRHTVLHLNEVDGPLFKAKQGDPRITSVGNFLRRTSLDELPQLWNVLRGEMSLVGPRPFVLYEADQITGWAARRLDMTPGITGLWQVLGRNDLPFEEMVKLDYLYVTNWSLWWDLKILCQTIPVVLGKRGAY